MPIFENIGDRNGDSFANDKQIKALLRKGQPGRHAVGGGLYFRVSSEGTGFWVVRYTMNGKRREITLGRYPATSLAGAGLEAAQLKAAVRKGIDPLAERKRPDTVSIRTVDDLAKDWLKNDIERRLKHPCIPRRIYERLLSPRFAELALSRVNPLDVRHALEAIAASGRPTVANDALGYCKQLFLHGIRLDLMKSNPAEAFSVHHAGGVEQSRSRALNIDELQTVFRVFRENSDSFTRDNYLAMALLPVLGVRKGELIAARWEEFDFGAAVWNLPESRSKTGAAISIPLPAVAIELLEELRLRGYGSDYVFPARRASKRRDYISDDTLNHALAKMFGQKVQPGDAPANELGKVGIDHFTVHDLRRTYRSLLAAAGVSGHVAERCLNHELKSVDGIYDRHDYLDERREALQKIADQLTPIIEPVENVTSFRGNLKYG
ncbi:MAG: tyrosine-type recombinase/integrase [Pseudomonadales bacterium]